MILVWSADNSSYDDTDGVVALLNTLTTGSESHGRTCLVVWNEKGCVCGA